MSETHVWVYNPELDAKWESPVDYLPVALARGWELTDPPSDEYPAPVVDEEAEAKLAAAQAPFDPSDHTVAEVQEYLETHGDSPPGEGDRVLAAERAGKNRVSLTGEAEDEDEPDDGE
jgi:hypothetical protein